VGNEAEGSSGLKVMSWSEVIEWLEMSPDDWHRPCPRCHKARTWGTVDLVVRRCLHGGCKVVVHRPCGTVETSWGPPGCPCNEKIKLLPKLPRRSARRWR
jgi:hypothetical protein